MGEMLQEGTMPLNDAETAAIEKLKADFPGEMRSFTRTEAEETGPLHVTVGDSPDETIYEVAEDGKTVKLGG